MLSSSYARIVMYRMNAFYWMLIGFFVFLLIVFQSIHSVDTHSNEYEHTSLTDSARFAHEKPLRILITGAAGFIGMHTAIALHSRGDFVVGLDNFNPYYDVKLKHLRQATLRKLGINIVTGDVCDSNLLSSVFQEHRITHTVHLAAQAGVRYSLKFPGEYIRTNINCTLTLLEVVRSMPNGKNIPIAYASSSSVYGRNKKVPFLETDVIRDVNSVYGASKYATELLAHVYHNLYGLRVTGLRFFTVYGPYGRPDMTYFFFSERIMQNKEIEIFKLENGEFPIRDFTFINDTVNGIVRALDYGADDEIFNLGPGHPSSVMDLVHALERALGRKAKLVYKKLPSVDVSQTFSDSSKALKYLGVQATTDLETGLTAWAVWFRLHYLKNLMSYDEK